MKARLLRLLDVEPDEVERVFVLFVMGFCMGMFIAAINVASQSLFLEHFDEETELPVAFVVSGVFGLLATLVYTFLQNRIPFPALAGLSLLTVAGITAFIEFGESVFSDPTQMYAFGFTQILPLTFIVYLVFWGSFGRLFKLRQARRLVGLVDIGALMATFVAFFSVPVLISIFGSTQSLYGLALVSILIFIGLFGYLTLRHLSHAKTLAEEKAQFRKLSVKEFLGNRYIVYMSLFIIFSMMASDFVDYSFYNVTTMQFDTDSLASFIAYFEGTIVIFGFLFQVFATDRIHAMYGMRVSLLVTPVLIGLFTACALGIGFLFGYSPQDNFFVLFFMMVAVSKLFINSLKEGLDNPTFKLYLLPLESNIRIDVQTKIEGIVTAIASIVAGLMIILITRIEIFNLIHITLFTLPLIALWFLVVNKMHFNYRRTLQNALERNKNSGATAIAEYSVNAVLQKQLSSEVEEKVIYGLRLMEKLDPALFETAILRIASDDHPRLRKFAEERIEALGIAHDDGNQSVRSLARLAASETEDSDVLAISTDKLMKLSKSHRQDDRTLAAKLLVKHTDQRTLFMLLELLRDPDSRVRFEALKTARKVQRPETWSLLIEMLGSPLYGHHAAAALRAAGPRALNALEAAFHKSGQSETVMLRIVQIMGGIRGHEALHLLWKKADYPDKKIVRQILYALRYVNHRPEGREATMVMELVEMEISKAIWNLAALQELPRTPEMQFLREALEEEVTQNHEQIFMLLSILYDPESVELVRQNISSGDHESIAFALELLDLFIDQELKPKLLPLLDDKPVEEKLRLLQYHFPREHYTPIQVINYLLNRDYNLVNRWTKVCAVHAAAYMNDFRVSRGLVAQVFNDDRLLQETAAWVVYQKDRLAFSNITERLPLRDRRFVDTAIKNNQLLDGLDDGFFLQIEMVMLIRQLPVFRDIHGVHLAELADKITAVELAAGERLTLPVHDEQKAIFIVAHGEVKVIDNERVLDVMERGAIYGELFTPPALLKAEALVARERTILFRVTLLDLYFVMANNHELVQGLVRNLTTHDKTLTLQH
jgi:AAA family ATP:ADP antiporter